MCYKWDHPHLAVEYVNINNSVILITMDSNMEDGIQSLDNRFSLLVRMFKIGGLPIYREELPRLYFVYSVTLASGAFFSFVSIVLAIAHNQNDIAYVMEAARPGITMMSVMWADFFLSLKMQGVRTLLRMARDFNLSKLSLADGSTISNPKEEWIPYSQKVAWRASLVILFGHGTYLILRMIRNGTENTFFYNSWFPFSTDKLLIYVLVLIHQFCGSILLGNTVFAFMTLYGCLMTVGCMELEALHSTLLDIRQSQPEMKERLAQCIKRHQEILRYLAELEDTFNLALLGPFLSVAIILCFTALTVITAAGGFVELIQVAMLVFVMLGQLQIYCWFATEIKDKSGLVRDAAWGSDWVGAPVSYQRSINIMMIAADDYTFTAGKIIPVTRRTMMLVLNETYSYVMFLMNFVGESSDK